MFTVPLVVPVAVIALMKLWEGKPYFSKHVIKGRKSGCVSKTVSDWSKYFSIRAVTNPRTDRAF